MYLHLSAKSATRMISKAVYSIDYRCINKLNKFIKAHKDKKIISDKNNIIYKIQCNNCDVSYVGQTKKKLNTKINEHIKNIKLGSSQTFDYNRT